MLLSFLGGGGCEVCEGCCVCCVNGNAVAAVGPAVGPAVKGYVEPVVPAVPVGLGNLLVGFGLSGSILSVEKMKKS